MFVQGSDRTALVCDSTIFRWFHHVCDITEQRGTGAGGPCQGTTQFYHPERDRYH